MKLRSTALLLGVFLVFATAAGVLAQSPPSDSTAQSDSAAKGGADVKGSADVKAGGTDVKGSADVKAEGKVEKSPSEGAPSRSDQRSDVNVNVGKDRSAGRSDDSSGSALPREVARDRGTILGLSPTAAIVVAAALLVVVILAIVAMTRSNGRDTYIDTSRRM